MFCCPGCVLGIHSRPQRSRQVLAPPKGLLMVQRSGSPSSMLPHRDGRNPESLQNGSFRAYFLLLCFALSEIRMWRSNDSSDVTAMPLACPQSDLDSSQYSEDCLSMVLYVPATLTVSDNVPTLTWCENCLSIICQWG